MKYSTEIVRKIYDDKTGDMLEIGPDADGLDMVAIFYGYEGQKKEQRISMPPDQARLVAAAIVQCADELEKAELERASVKQQ